MWSMRGASSSRRLLFGPISSILALMSYQPTGSLAFTSPVITRTPLFTRTTATRLFSTMPSICYLLHYDYIPDVLEKRGPYREGHLDLAKKLIAEGTCLSGGPTSLLEAESPKGALFVFTEQEAAEMFLEHDPYVKNGIVTRHSIEKWSVVVQK
mmetsp:Transcript_22462/g.34338  ORF Transcript_22462/g.34338 Transcript_22462/m.34338 type:complete len:154 (-) Transcript_22462:1139-1600(-)